jgi:hypothetical protein
MPLTLPLHTAPRVAPIARATLQPPPTDATAPWRARLRIHVSGDPARPRPFERAQAWLRSLLRLSQGPTRVCIDDLQGHCFLTADAAPALLEVPLPAGTYHVTVRQGRTQRRYTVTLQQGATVNLVLHPANPRV